MNSPPRRTRKATDELELIESPRRPSVTTPGVYGVNSDDDDSGAGTGAPVALGRSPRSLAGGSALPRSKDYDEAPSEEDEDVLTFTHEIAAASAPATASTGRASHHRVTPSTSRLLSPDDDYDDPQHPRGDDDDDHDAPRRWARLKRDYEDHRPGIRGVIDRTFGFIKRNEGFLLIGIAQAFFATISACVKALQERIAMPVWELILIRMSLTWLGCYTYMRLNHIEHPLLGPPGVRLLLAARGFVGFWGIFPLYYSLRYIPLSDATVLGFLAPFIIGVLGTVFLGEPYSLTEGVVALISLFGVVLIAKPSFVFPHQMVTTPEGVTPEQRTFAVFVCLCSSFGAAGAYLLIRRIGKRASATHSISYFAIYCVLVSSIYPLVIHSPPVFHLLDPTFWLLITPIGVFGFIAQALLTLGLQRETAGRGSLAVFSNLLFAMIIEKIVFGKLPDVLSLFGAAIIVGGGVKIALMKASAASAVVSTTANFEEEGDDDDGTIRVKVEGTPFRARAGSGGLSQGMDPNGRNEVVAAASNR